MRAALVLLVLAAIAAFLLTVGEPFGPQATLDMRGDAVGRATPVTVTARDRGTGVAHVDLRLVPGNGEPAVLVTRDFPRGSLGWPSAPGLSGIVKCARPSRSG